MPAPLYTVSVIIAALKNVPALGYRIARANGRAIFAQHPGVLVVTESWAALTKLGLRRAAPKTWRWYTARSQSVMLGWDSTRYRAVWKKRIKGGASPAIRGVTDRRDLFIVCLEDIATGRRFLLVGVHTSPLPTKKAPSMVPVAQRSHVHAGDQITVVHESTGYPVIAAGDWNTPELLHSDLHIGPGITHAECWDGENVTLHQGGKVLLFALHSDHPGVRFIVEGEAA